MTHILTATKQAIAQASLSDTLLLTAVKNRLHTTFINEKLTARLLDRMSKFHQVWDLGLHILCHQTSTVSWLTCDACLFFLSLFSLVLFILLSPSILPI